MKTSSAKAKGFGFQKTIAKMILDKFPMLEERDVVSAPNSVKGEDIILSETARKLLPVNFEAKRQEKMSIFACLKQCELESEKQKTQPILVFKRNHSKIYATIEFDYLLELLYNNSGVNKKEMSLDNTEILTKLKEIFTEDFMKKLF
jgi:hypothetical protein